MAVLRCALFQLAEPLFRNPELAHDEHFIKTRELIIGVQEDGSFKSFMRRPHRSILRLRSLVCRGRATLARMPRGRLPCYGAAREDYAIELLVKPDVPREMVWNILSFWRASN